MIMKLCFALIAALIVEATAYAQDAERIEMTLGDVYSATWSLDQGLTEYPQIRSSLRAAELDILDEFANLAVSDHKDWMLESPEWSWNAYFIDITVETAFSGRGIISLVRTGHVYTGGAHPNQSVSAVLTRVESYRPVGLAELFSDTSVDSPAMTALFYAVYRELMALKRVRLGSDFDETMERDTWLSPLAANLEAFPDFSLIPNETGEAAAGLMFHFEPYAVGSYAEGGYDVVVPLSVFDRYLAPDWTEAFEGQPLQEVLTEPGDALEPIIPE
ncbi:MAG: hypothetical protein DHS20C06_03920 [Hyphobacterium sp.]|nr:MAG: hypothetical protein DHS20C06_03920 [Hyphobacterium sp.]